MNTTTEFITKQLDIFANSGSLKIFNDIMDILVLMPIDFIINVIIAPFLITSALCKFYK